MNYTNQSIIDACTNCFIVCSHCYSKCLDKEGMQRCVRLCIECAEICKTVAALAAQDSPNLSGLVEPCAQLCYVCAAECFKHDHEHCQQCGEVCRSCAEVCRSMNISMSHHVE